MNLLEVFEELKSGEQGLTSKEALLRLQIFGQNKLPEAKSDGFIKIFFSQFKSPLIYILLGACFIVFLLAEFIDGFIILAVLILNAIVGTVQEGKAQNTLRALKKYTETSTAVLRDGKEVILTDKELVPGDIILLQEGAKIPADARLILANNLKIDESALTGESGPVHKTLEPDEKSLVARDMVFKGTSMLSGSGKAVVIYTGIKTAVGKIAKEIASIDAEMPLKKNIKSLSRWIIVSVAVVNILLFSLGVISGQNIKDLVLIMVSISVSMVPEGLPIVITLILAAGVWRMSKRNALVKKLQAVEALGQAEIIAVDKTGTITKNEMVVQKVFVDNALFKVEGIGYEPKGSVRINKELVEPLNHPGFIFAVKNAALCVDARVMFSEKEKQWQARGDPTEAALLVLSKKIGLNKDVLERESPSIVEFPFDYQLKMRASLRGIGKTSTLIVAGAPENILSISEKVWHSGKCCAFLKDEKEQLKDVFERMSEQGLRVVALAISERPQKRNPFNKLTFVSLFGMKDALRPEIKESVKKAQSAGVRVIMITGDYRVTAKAIASEAGIYKQGDKIIDGDQLEKTKDITSATIFARVTPSHKLKIINAFKAERKIIAMTGDGVNDAPSLVAADLGVSMGKIGTEVAKEASDIVLLDDNFESIISAIEEGRSIYKTIKKVILYLFSTSIGEVLVIAIGFSLGYPLVILPVQIIWLNFVTDGFLDIALASEPAEKMSSASKHIIDPLMILRMVLMAVPMAIGALIVFGLEPDLARARTTVLLTLAVFQWFNAWNCRSDKKSLFHNILSNKFLLFSTLAVIFLQALAVYHPFFQSILHTVPLALGDWALAIGIASSIILIEEARKFLSRSVERLGVLKKNAI